MQIADAGPKYRKGTVLLHNDPWFRSLSGTCRCTRRNVLLQGSLTTLVSAYCTRLRATRILHPRLLPTEILETSLACLVCLACLPCWD